MQFKKTEGTTVYSHNITGENWWSHAEPKINFHSGYPAGGKWT